LAKDGQSPGTLAPRSLVRGTGFSRPSILATAPEVAFVQVVHERFRGARQRSARQLASLLSHARRSPWWAPRPAPPDAAPGARPPARPPPGPPPCARWVGSSIEKMGRRRGRAGLSIRSRGKGRPGRVTPAVRQFRDSTSGRSLQRRAFCRPMGPLPMGPLLTKPSRRRQQPRGPPGSEAHPATNPSRTLHRSSPPPPSEAPDACPHRGEHVSVASTESVEPGDQRYRDGCHTGCPGDGGDGIRVGGQSGTRALRRGGWMRRVRPRWLTTPHRLRRARWRVTVSRLAPIMSARI
jgi:hypothetical protein